MLTCNLWNNNNTNNNNNDDNGKENVEANEECKSDMYSIFVLFLYNIVNKAGVNVSCGNSKN